MFKTFTLFLIGSTLVSLGCSSESKSGSAAQREIEILNASYDPTRELWKDLNAAFIKGYEKEHGRRLSIKQSHAASGSQARAIIDGLDADVATLSIWPDVDAIRKKGLIKEGWEDRLPNRSLPYTSLLVFVTRKGNPKGVKDWPDLVKGDISIITPNPKTSGNGKFSLLGAWGSVTQRGGTEQEAREFVQKIFSRVPVLDVGARGATTTFAQKKIGDVHLALESEARLEVNESKGELEIVFPPITILAEPHLAVVDATVDRKGTREVAEAYLKFVYTPEAQELVARNYFRPSDAKVLAAHRELFPEVKLFAAQDLVKERHWDQVIEQFFGKNGEFEKISLAGAASTR